MADLILCYEKDCSVEEKFSENPRQFQKIDGPHKGHKVAYFDDLCETFKEKFGQSIQEKNEESLMVDIRIMFETFKRDISVQMEIHQKNLQRFIQAKAKDDMGVQLYLSVLQKDIKKVKECSSVFFMIDQLETIQDAYTKNLDESDEYIKNSQIMMNSRINHMNDQLQVLVQGGNEYDKEMIINQLNHLQKQIHSIQNVSIIQVVEVLEAQQRVIQLLLDQSIMYVNDTDLCISLTNTKLEQHNLQDSISQNKITSLMILKETINADFQDLIVKIDIESQQLSDQNEIELKDHQVSLQKVKNELYACQQTLNERDEVINALHASLRDFKQNELDQNDITLISIDHQVSLQKVKNELHACQQTLNERDELIDGLHTSLRDLKQNEMNQNEISFLSKTNDTIFCTVNPTNETITFKNSSSNESFVMNYQPTTQELHPCVCLQFIGNQVEFIQPE